jgi:hypothetical protein
MLAGLRRHLAVTTASIGLFGAAAALTGCSSADASETVASSTSGALIVVDPALAASAQVADGTVSFPLATASDLQAHQPGDLLVSPRVAGSAGNSTGFLRKFASSQVQGDRLVVTTTPATLTDVVSDGSAQHTFSVPTSASSIDLGRTTLTSVSVDLSTVDPALAGNTFSLDVTLDEAHLGFQPDLDFSMAFADGKLSALHMATSGSLSASMGVDVDARVTGTLLDDGLAALGHYSPSIKQRLWSSPVWNLPTQWIGLVPVEESVQMYLTAKCSVSLQGFTGGELQAHATASGTATIDGGIDYDGSNWTTTDGSDFAGNGTLTVASGATEALFCQVIPSLAIRFYDVAGPELGVGAGLDFSVQQPAANQGSATGPTWTASPELRATVQGDVTVLGYNAALGPFTLYQDIGTPFASSSVGN